MKKVLLSWSSGKDSVWALNLLRQQPDLEVAALLTTFNSGADRVAMHAVRRTLVETQAGRTGIPMWSVELPWPCSNFETRIECPKAVAARDVAKRAHETTGQVFRYAIAHGIASRNLAADFKPKDILAQTKEEHFARVDAKELPDLLLKVESYDGDPLSGSRWRRRGAVHGPGFRTS